MHAKQITNRKSGVRREPLLIFKTWGSVVGRKSPLSFGFCTSAFSKEDPQLAGPGCNLQPQADTWQ